MGARCYIGADSKEKEQLIEVQDKNVELYYQLVFVSSVGSSPTVDSGNAYMGELFSSRMVYLNPICGIDKGVVANSVHINVDCSSVDTDLELNLEKVDSIIRQVEYKIDNDLYGYMDKASLVTLHLAIQSDTLTEDIARCFAYGIDSDQEFCPEEELLKNQLLLSEYKVFQNAKTCGFNIQIDYFHTFDIRPVLVSNEPIDDSIFFSPLEYSEEEISSDTFNLESSNTIDMTNYNTSTNVMSRVQSESGALQAYVAYNDSSPWPKTESGALKASVVVYDMPDGKWSWKQSREVAHPVLEKVSSESGWISLGAAAVAVTALGVGLVVSAPAVATVAGLALFAAGVSGGISTTASVTDAYVYFFDAIDAANEGDVEKTEEDCRKMRNKLFWELFTLGAGKGFKKGFQFMSKKLNVSNKALEKVIKQGETEVDRIESRQHIVDRNIRRLNKSNEEAKNVVEKEAQKVSKMKEDAKLSKPSKREIIRREENKLRELQQKTDKNLRKNNRRIDEYQKESVKNNTEMDNYRSINEIIQEMPSDSIEDVTSSGINVLHNSSTTNQNNIQE